MDTGAIPGLICMSLVISIPILFLFTESPRDKIRIHQYVANRGGKSIKITWLFSGNNHVRHYQVSYTDAMGERHETTCQIQSNLRSHPPLYWSHPIAELPAHLNTIDTTKSSKEQIIDDLTVENEALALENEQLRTRLENINE